MAKLPHDPADVAEVQCWPEQETGSAARMAAAAVRAGWDDDGIFNFEGGCYAKTINLSHENEPEIYDAIKRDALLENVAIKVWLRLTIARAIRGLF